MLETIIGFDIGGSKIGVVEGDRTGTIYQHESVSNGAEVPFEQALARMVDLAAQLIARSEHQPNTMSVSIGGPLHIERGIILMRGDYLDEESLPIPVQRFAMKNETPPSASAPPGSLEEAEQSVIKNILAETGGNKSEASRRLNITRKTLLSKMHKYGLS
jgi:transcriptional regulator of acetoin/glycerol metabolism